MYTLVKYHNQGNEYIHHPQSFHILCKPSFLSGASPSYLQATTDLISITTDWLTIDLNFLEFCIIGMI